MEKSLAEQTAQLAVEFPIGCKVRVVVEDIPGRIEGYRMGADIKRPNELAMTVCVPADRWVLYADEVERVVESNN